MTMRMTSSTKILVGLVSGVIVGLFFLGEHAGVLKVVADGFVRLLQMMVLPISRSRSSPAWEH